jgi:sirohydrochlorin cobaltochelatase
MSRLAAIPAEFSEPIGVMVCGHGSRDGEAVAEFAALAERLKPHFPDWPVDYGYLEFARPVIRDGLDRLVAQGVRHILAVPGMLFAAGHAKNDIPSVLNTYQAGRPGLRIEYARELGIDPKMIRAAGARIRAALDAAPAVPLHETLLLVVGRGASDPDANSNVAKVTRMLWEGFGFGWAETAYSGVTFPLVAPALDKAARLGFRRIVVFPYFLFTGILVQRIYEAADAAAARHPGIEIVKAPYLNDHPLVMETFVDRVEEILAGQNLMNCQLCKYRTQVLGFESEVGLPQASHHHHVEGIGLKADPPPSLATGEGDHAKHGGGGDHHRGDHHHGHHHHHHHGDDHAHPHDHDHTHPGSHPKDPESTPASPSPGRIPAAASTARGRAHGHDSGHHHHPYPHADHPLGPRSLKRP